MRKLFLLAAFGLFATPAMSQNTANMTQTGDANSVDANQSGANSAVVSQTSTAASGGHEALITQVGANDVMLTQTYGTNALGPKGAHTATIDQNGYGNVVSGEQGKRSNSTADVDQIGNGNTATFSNTIDLTQYQEGNDNTAISYGGGTVEQWQIGDGNYAENRGNDAYQRQEGAGNYALSTSWVSGSATSQEQFGDNNESYFRQLRHGGNYAMSYQQGNNNLVDADWNQNGGNSLTVTQIGDFNTVMADFQGPGNTTIVTQTGNNNSAVITQGALAQ